MLKHIRLSALARRLRRFALGPFDAFVTHANLTRELTKRDILGRYRGASFGLLWSLIAPLTMLIIYTVAFGQILGSRWSQSTGDAAAFGVVLFLGIIVHGFFAECFARSPRLMVDNANYVKRIVFPLHILPWSIVLSALFHMAMNMIVFTAIAAIWYGKFSPYIFLLPIVVAPLVLLTVAVCWLVASLGVYLRDINQTVPVVVTALLFLSSAIIPVEHLPERYRIIFELNPLTFFIDQVRDVALWEKLPDWNGLLKRAVAALGVLYASYGWFRFSSRGFADVL